MKIAQKMAKNAHLGQCFGTAYIILALFLKENMRIVNEYSLYAILKKAISIFVEIAFKVNRY